jgi:iron complex outermembrane receptor protein
MDPVSSYVSANNLKTVSCETGGEGKCYGSSTGGQVNFQLKEPLLNDEIKLRGNISLGGNSVSNGKQGSFNTNYSEKNWAIRFNGMAASHQNYHAGGGLEVKNSQYSKANFGLSVKVKIGGRSFIQLDAISDDARDIGYPALPMDVAYASGKIYAFTFKRFIKGNLGGKLTAKIYGNNIRHLMDDSEREVVMHMDMPGLSDTYGTFISYQTKEIRRHTLNLTIDGYTNRSFAEMTMFPEGEREMYMLTWPDVNRTILGVFVSETYRFRNEDQLIWTGRIDGGESRIEDELGQKQFEVFGYDVSEPFVHRAVSSSLKYIKVINQKNALSAEVGYNERLPSVSEQFAYYIFNSKDAYDYIGDPNILNESAYKAELGYEKHTEKINLTSAVYTLHIPNYILGIADTDLDGMTFGSKGVKQYENITFAILSGFEIEFDLKLTKWMKFSTGFSYTYGRDYSGTPLPLMPPLKNNTHVIFKIKKNHLRLALATSSAQNRYRESEGETVSPAYSVLNAQYSRRIGGAKHGLLVISGVDNIFDTYYYDHMDWNSLPRAGRNFFLKLQYQFN